MGWEETRGQDLRKGGDARAVSLRSGRLLPPSPAGALPDPRPSAVTPAAAKPPGARPLLRLLLTGALLALGLSAVTASFHLPLAAARPNPCDKLLDFSGSVTDYPLTRQWLGSTLQAVLESERSLDATGAATFVAYGNTARFLTVPPEPDPQNVLDAVLASMGTSEGTNPLAGFELLLGSSSSTCLVHITDGTLDLPSGLQGDEAGYMERLLTLAEEFGRQGRRIVTIAQSDASGDIWGEFTRRSGGVYLVLPDARAVSDALASLLQQGTPGPVSTPAPALEAAAPAASAPGPEPETPGAGWTRRWPLAVPAVLLIACLSLAALRLHRRTHLTGWLEAQEERDV
jgi:hypothetical protein